MTNPPVPYIQVARGPVAPSGVLLFETPLAEGSDDDLGPVSTLIRFRQKRGAQDLSWEQQLNSQRIAAIRKWVQIILTTTVAFDLGRKLERGAPLGDSIASGLKHVFAGKATGTLHNRAGPVLRFLQWCRNNAIIPFPIHERHVYAFMVDVGHSAAPTFLRSFFGFSYILQLHFGPYWSRRSNIQSEGAGLCKRVLLDKEEVAATSTSSG